MKYIKVVHTADVHLGKRFPHMEREADTMRSEDLFRVFGDLVTHVIRNETDLLLVAGDLFDRANTRRETMSQVLEWFSKIHEALPGSRIVLTPGEDEVFVRKDGRWDCVLSVFDHLPYVDVLGGGPEPDRRIYELAGREITVTSCPFELFFDPAFKAKNIPMARKGFGIFVLHAFSRRLGMRSMSDDEVRDRILDPLASRGYGYCALGHRHTTQAVEHDAIKAAWPGSLERLSFDEDRGRKSFISFTIDDTNKMSRLEAVRSAVRPLEHITIPCTLGENRLDSILEDTLQRGGRDKVLHIALEGQMEFELFNSFKKSEILSRLREKFAIVHIDNRLVLVSGREGYDYAALKVGTPAEEFKRYIEREISATRPGSDERALLVELYKMGVKELEQEP